MKVGLCETIIDTVIGIIDCVKNHVTKLALQPVTGVLNNFDKVSLMWLVALIVQDVLSCNRCLADRTEAAMYATEFDYLML